MSVKKQVNERIVHRFPLCAQGRPIEISVRVGGHERVYLDQVMPFMTRHSLGFEFRREDRTSGFPDIGSGSVSTLEAYQLAELCSIRLVRLRPEGGSGGTATDLIRALRGNRSGSLVDNLLGDFGEENESIDEVLRFAGSQFPSSAEARSMMDRMSQEGVVAFARALDDADKSNPGLRLFDKALDEYVREFGLNRGSFSSPRTKMLQRFRGW